MKWALSIAGVVCVTLSLLEKEAFSHMYINGFQLICVALIFDKLEEK